LDGTTAAIEILEVFERIARDLDEEKAPHVMTLKKLLYLFRYTIFLKDKIQGR
jgi:hypothetical protein